MLSFANDLNLKGQFLIATPKVTSDIFAQSVIYMFEHNANGAVGIVINKPSKVPFVELLGDLSEIDCPEEEILRNIDNTLVFAGGPVNRDKGYVLHSAERFYRATIIHENIAFTSSRDILIDYAKGNGPKHILLALGCASWDAGQLESEIMANFWLTAPANETIMFTAPVVEKHRRAISSLGIEPCSLLWSAGNA